MNLFISFRISEHISAARNVSKRGFLAHTTYCAAVLTFLCNLSSLFALSASNSHPSLSNGHWHAELTCSMAFLLQGVRRRNRVFDALFMCLATFVSKHSVLLRLCRIRRIHAKKRKFAEKGSRMPKCWYHIYQNN